MAPILGYWNIRGIAQPIRLMLAYTETPFEDVKYPGGPYSNDSAWLDAKKTLPLAFPNLPYYIEDDVKLSHSIAIMRYLARKHKLDAETEEERMRADMIEQQMADIRAQSFGSQLSSKTMRNSTDFKNLNKEYLKNLPTILKSLSNFLGKRQYFASQKKLTYVDFIAYETLDRLKLSVPGCLDDFPNLKEFMNRFEKIPTIQKYMQTPDYMKF